MNHKWLKHMILSQISIMYAYIKLKLAANKKSNKLGTNVLQILRNESKIFHTKYWLKNMLHMHNDPFVAVITYCY